MTRQQHSPAPKEIVQLVVQEGTDPMAAASRTGHIKRVKSYEL